MRNVSFVGRLMCNLPYTVIKRTLNKSFNYKDYKFWWSMENNYVKKTFEYNLNLDQISNLVNKRLKGTLPVLAKTDRPYLLSDSIDLWNVDSIRNENKKIISIKTSDGGSLEIPRDMKLLTMNEHGRLVRSKPFKGMCVMTDYTPCRFTSINSISVSGHNYDTLDIKQAAYYLGVYHRSGRKVVENGKIVKCLIPRDQKLDKVFWFDKCCKDDKYFIITSPLFLKMLEEYETYNQLPVCIYSTTDMINKYIQGFFYKNKNHNFLTYTSSDIDILYQLSNYLFLSGYRTGIDRVIVNNQVKFKLKAYNIECNDYGKTSCNAPVAMLDYILNRIEFFLPNKMYDTIDNRLLEAKNNNQKLSYLKYEELNYMVEKLSILHVLNPKSDIHKFFKMSQYHRWVTIDSIQEVPELKGYSHSISLNRNHEYLLSHNGYIL